MSTKTKPKILHVDDNEMLREALLPRLEQTFDVIGCNDAKDAIQQMLAASKPPTLPIDAAILDVRLPGMDGFSLLAELRKTDPHLPVVMLTGLKDDEIMLKSFQLGANILIEKPSSANYITEQLLRLISDKTKKAAA